MMKFPNSPLTVPQVAYLSGAMGFSMLSTIQGFYYVKVFLNHYHISQTSFQISQAVYLVWNSLNDPLFAYIQDNAKYSFVRTRRHALLYGAPFWALSFLVFWFPWEAESAEKQGTWITGLHLMFSLVVYDAVFSFNGLAMCALYAEISPNQEDRVRLTRWGSCIVIVGSICLFLCEQFSDSLQIFHNFQMLCVVFATCSMFLTWYAGKYAITNSEGLGESRKEQMKDGQQESIWKLTWQIVTNRNFLAFVAVNFGQEFHRTFITNFMAIITESLVPTTVVPQYLRSLAYSGRSLISVALIIFGGPIINRVGYYRLVRGSFFVKIGLGIFLYTLGWSFRGLILLVMVIDSSFASCAFWLFNLCLSDIAEDDRQKYKRSVPNTAMAFGTNALVMKPVYSIAPMITTALLDARGYRHINDGSLKQPELETLNLTMFSLVCFIPIIIGALQYFAWTQYSLRETHKIKPSELGETDIITG